MAEPVVLVDDDDGVRTITLNRPASLNALNGAVVSALLAALDLEPPVPRAVVLTGSGGHFCSGGDRKVGIAIDDDIDRALAGLQEIARRLRNPEWASIAAVNGWAVGGGAELALGCDLRVVGTSARFKFPETQLDAHVTGGASWLLPRMVGISRANLLLLTGVVLDATAAASWGLAADVVGDDECLARAQELARLVADQPLRSVRATKDSINRALTSDLDAALDREQQVTNALLSDGGAHGLGTTSTTPTES